MWLLFLEHKSFQGSYLRKTFWGREHLIPHLGHTIEMPLFSGARAWGMKNGRASLPCHVVKESGCPLPLARYTSWGTWLNSASASGSTEQKWALCLIWANQLSWPYKQGHEWASPECISRAWLVQPSSSVCVVVEVMEPCPPCPYHLQLGGEQTQTHCGLQHLGKGALHLAWGAHQSWPYWLGYSWTSQNYEHGRFCPTPHLPHDSVCPRCPSPNCL